MASFYFILYLFILHWKKYISIHHCVGSSLIFPYICWMYWKVGNTYYPFKKKIEWFFLWRSEHNVTFHSQTLVGWLWPIAWCQALTMTSHQVLQSRLLTEFILIQSDQRSCDKSFLNYNVIIRSNPTMTDIVNTRELNVTSRLDS